MTRTRPLRSIAAAVLAATALAACNPSSGGLGTVPPAPSSPAPSVGQGSPDLTPEPSASPSPRPTGSPGASGSPAPAGTTVVRAYFHFESLPGSSGLVPVLREVPATKAVATAAMAALLDGPTETESGAMSSAVPAGTRLLGLAVAGGVATVDLSGEFESGGGSASVIGRLGQVVYTLTQFPTVSSVAFRVEGRPVTVFGSEGVVLDGPVGRADYEDLLPAIFVDRPAYGAAIGNPARITGTANTFEATFHVALAGPARRAGDSVVQEVVAQEVVTATCGTGCRGTFDVTLSYDVVEAGWGELRVWESSARDGSDINVRVYPVWLTPAG